MERVFVACCRDMARPDHRERTGYIVGRHWDLGMIAGITPEDVTWSADGTALLFVDRVANTPKLTRLEVDTTAPDPSRDPPPAARPVILGDLPPDYSSGLWRLP
jgi:hypothetical protein